MSIDSFRLKLEYEVKMLNEEYILQPSESNRVRLDTARYILDLFFAHKEEKVKSIYGFRSIEEEKCYSSL